MERNVFRKADGSTKVLSVVIRHTYEVKTDYLPEQWHRKLVIALSHDNVEIENENYLGSVSIDGDYNIDWQEFLNYPVAQATSTVQVTPFDATNSNCQTCDQAIQLELVDDAFPDPLEEGETYELPGILTNDSICCYPFTVELVSFNTDYLADASITDGVLSVTVKPETGSGENITLATYRVTCPDGSYDEAVVRGEVVGTAETCGMPSSPEADGITASSAHVSWTASVPPAVNGYEWRLYLLSDPVTPVQSGNQGAGVTDFTLTDLDPNTTYVFQVYSNCGDGNFSAPVDTEFTTNEPPVGAECGSYTVNLFAPGSANFSFLDCALSVKNHIVISFTPAVRCMSQTAPGVPTFFSSPNPDVTITYNGPC